MRGKGFRSAHFSWWWYHGTTSFKALVQRTQGGGAVTKPSGKRGGGQTEISHGEQLAVALTLKREKVSHAVTRVTREAEMRGFAIKDKLKRGVVGTQGVGKNRG